MTREETSLLWWYPHTCWAPVLNSLAADKPKAMWVLPNFSYCSCQHHCVFCFRTKLAALPSMFAFSLPEILSPQVFWSLAHMSSETLSLTTQSGITAKPHPLATQHSPFPELIFIYFLLHIPYLFLSNINFMRREYLAYDCFSIALNNYLLKKKKKTEKKAKEKIKEKEI